MLKCARCGHPMTVFVHQGANADHCRHCGSVFLERGEAGQAMSKEADPGEWINSNVATSLGQMKVLCPKDRTRFQGYRVAFQHVAVEVDVCPKCGGLWLDDREAPKLNAIVAEAKRVNEAPRGAMSYFFQLFTGLPIEVYNPVKRRPVVVFTLLGFLLIVFGLQVAAQATGGESGIKAFNDGWWLVPAKIFAGEEWWTLITSTFLHGGLGHFLGNAYFLWTFGDNVEDRLGRGRFLLLYFLAGLAASVMHVLFNMSSTIPCLGASGAIAGLMGAYLMLFPKTKVWVVLFFIRFRLAVFWYLGVWIAMQILQAMSGVPGVAWYAHIGGFLAGAVLAPVLRGREQV